MVGVVMTDYTDLLARLDKIKPPCDLIAADSAAAIREQAAEIERLTTEYRHRGRLLVEMQDAESALAQDAERWRWAREIANRNHDWAERSPKVTIYFPRVPHNLNGWVNDAPQTADLDAAIDAAIAASKEQG